MDYMACVSYGVYPTPTPTDAKRAAFGVSMGLIDFALAAVVPSGFVKHIYDIGLRAFQILRKRIR